MSLPSNIKSFLKRNGNSLQTAAANKIGQWCDKLGHKVVDGTAVGKYYDTLILDLTYHGSEIYIHENGFEETRHGYPGVTINDVAIDGTAASFKTFAAEVEKIFPSKTASIKAGSGFSKSHLIEMAKDDVISLGDDKQWVKHILNDNYAAFKMHEGTELSEREFDIYQEECGKWLPLKAARVAAYAMRKVAGGLTAASTKETYFVNVPLEGARGFQIEADLRVELTRDADTNKILRMIAYLKEVNASKYDKLDNFLFNVADNDLDARRISNLGELFDKLLDKFETGPMYKDNGEIPYLPNQSAEEDGDIHMQFAPKGFNGKELNIYVKVGVEMEARTDRNGEFNWALRSDLDRACFCKTNNAFLEARPGSSEWRYLLGLLEKQTRFVARKGL